MTDLESVQALPEPLQALPEPLKNALEAKGYDQLTSVQQAVAQHLLVDGKGGNLRISSETGSGKTVAIGLAISQPLLELSGPRPAGPTCLVITPTRELAIQVRDELRWLFSLCKGVRVDCVTGGTDLRKDRDMLRTGPSLLVGTPGRLLDHLRSGTLKSESISSVVLDEADQLLEFGFREELDAIIEQLPAERNSHLVSATFPPVVEQLARQFQGQWEHLEGTQLGAANGQIEHIAYLAPHAQRYASLVNILLEIPEDRCLIFVRTRTETTDLAERLAGDGFSALPFSGELPQAQRMRTLSAFRSATVKILVATDVAARGIDVPNIGTVIQTDTARDLATYTHRSGRTGRAGRSGRSVSMVPPSGRFRLERIAQAGNIELTWAAVPTARKIEKAVVKATRRRLFESLEAETHSEAELSYARSLLEAQDPATVVSTLLKLAELKLPRAPFDLKPMAPQAERRPRQHAARPEADSRGRQEDRQAFVPFELSWGALRGANPNRCLSHVCRRGGIDRRDVGQIEVGDHTTIVQVSETAASDFERNVRRPDERDPHVRIRRLNASARRKPAGPPRRHVPARNHRPTRAGERIPRRTEGSRDRSSAVRSFPDPS